MKRFLATGLILVLAVGLIGCGGRHKSGGGTSYTAGQAVGYSVGGVNFYLHYVPAVSNFPNGPDASSTATATVAAAFWTGRTEVTYELWKAVYDWAKTNGYTFVNTGYNGSGNTGSSYQQPVCKINWREAMIWCNALTEYYNAANGTGYDCVYYSDAAYTTPIRTATSGSSYNTTAGSEDTPYIKAAATGNTAMTNCTAKGFRLPTYDEWDLLARYIDGSKFYPGDYASGADADYDDTATTDYDGDTDIQSTDAVAVYNVAATADVMSKAANALGLYDVSGNVAEWYFYISSSNHMARGGYWSDTDSVDMMLSMTMSTSPNTNATSIGFRITRTN